MRNLAPFPFRIPNSVFRIRLIWELSGRVADSFIFAKRFYKFEEMAKEFNITGTCIPSKHYMADTSGKMKHVMELIERGKYFTINRPRQYGKTTTLALLNAILNNTEEYLVIKTSFEGVGDVVFLDEKSFSPMFIRQLAKGANYLHPELSAWMLPQSEEVDALEPLSKFISRLVEKAGKKIVLLIDEVDKSSNNQLFVSFLAMLRNKYLDAQENLDSTFHSVVLAGLHDVKTLKLKLRPDEEAKFNSPWNIAADFKVDMNLQPHEIVPMLEDYSQERDVKMDAPLIAERLFYYTSGYPFLVSALCKITDEDILPQKEEKTWTSADIETAADLLIKSERSNTNFDTLVKNLENDPALYDIVFRVVIENESLNYNVHDPVIYFGILHGIFRNGDGLNIHNRIYREVIGNYMTSKLSTSGKALESPFAGSYILPTNALDLEKVLSKFQEYMREEYSKKDKDFLERYGRLIFLAFLKPIINGKGYTFKEPEVSEERRLDIAITFYRHKYVAELKIWRGDIAHDKGLSQLAGYLDRQQLTEGYLVIFDKSGKKTWKKEWVEVEGKKVFVVWV